jgi:uncharacterized protein (TIGR01244 family)
MRAFLLVGGAVGPARLSGTALRRLFLFSREIRQNGSVMKNLFCFVLFSLIAFGQSVVPVAVGKAPNSSVFASKVYFAGQPESADFAEYARLGVKVVINLRPASEMEGVSFNEAEAAKAAGLEYVNVPLEGARAEEFDASKIFAYLAKAGEAKVLLHCVAANRAGFVWSLYRGTQEGLGVEEAIAEGKQAGLKGLEKTARKRLEAAASKK